MALGVAVAVAGGGAVSAAGSAQPEAVPGELIVGFEEGVSEGQQTAALARAGAARKRGFRQIRAALVSVPESQITAVAKALASDPRVRYVERNHVVRALVVPNDPSFGQLWGLDNTGQTGGTVDADIDAPEAWDAQTGSSNVVVAVTDTGVDFTHPDLTQQQWINPGENCGSSDPTIPCAQRDNDFDDDGNGLRDDYRGWDFVSNDNDPSDDHDHGTHVAGTIGAVGNNGTGVTGVNWNVKVMALKFLNSAGSGSTAGAVSATLYAADHGADVASNSWGGGPAEQALLDAIEYGASQGMLFVAAAGNDSRNNDTTPTYPANYASEVVVSVAATDDDDLIASFSNYGAKSVDLGAPGVSILSTTRGGTYKLFSGTSMATPHVSGVAALAKAHFPGATPYTLKALLLGSVDPNASLTGKTRTDGRLNAANAVSCSNVPEVVLEAPADGFKASVGEPLEISVIGASCAAPAGVANVSVTVNGTSVSVSSATPDTGLYTASYTPVAEGSLTITAGVTVGAMTDSETVNGTAAFNYACVNITDSWVDVTPGTKLTTASSSDDDFSTLNITFPFPFYGQTYTTAHVSSNGFLTLGSSTGADAFANVAIPNTAVPNGLVAAFWDDLNPAASGDVYAGLTGSSGSRVLHVEWFNVPHFSLFGSGVATFEMSLYEATGEIRFRYLDTDFGNSDWNFGRSATGGVEKVDGSFGKQISYNEPALTSGRAISCTFNTPPPPPSAPMITTTVLDDGTTQQSYSETLTATGGTTPYTWSLDSGSMPTGLTLNANGTITGTPTATGSFSFTARVTDSASQTDTQPLSIAVADPLSITTTSLPGVTAGQPYSQQVTATGGNTNYSWTLLSGSLPPGLTLTSGTPSATISGTPTTAGTYAFTLQATDSGAPARTATQALSITVVDPLAITTTSLPGATAGQAYSQQIGASGGETPYTWSVVAGSLPPGLSLSSGTPAATVSGTPTTAGTYAFTVQVSDAGNPARTATQQLSITVASDEAPTITVQSVTYATEGGRFGNNHLLVTVRIMSGTTPVANANVTVDVSRSSQLYATRTATTGSDGRVTFKFTNYPTGCYTTQVTRVVVNGQTWTPTTPSNSHCK